jgi:cytochrome c biogenesis protein CcmG/thiol:disulfide interchange protein DsbE
MVLLGLGGLGVINLLRTEKPSAGLSDGRDAPMRDFEALIGPQPSYNFSTPPGDKPIAVNLFASWCAPCKVEHPLLLELEQSYPDQIYGLLYDDLPEKGRGFLKRLGNPYTAVALDPDGQGGLDFGLTGVPETFVISPEGKILLHIRGPLDTDSINQISSLLTQ